MSEIQKILKIKDPNDYSIAITDFVWGNPCEFDEMPEAQKVVHCIGMLEMEVNNGGFEQFFYNSSGDTTPEALAALKAIGAKKCLELVQQAIDLFPKGEPPRNQEDRQARQEKLPEKINVAWDKLDQKFFEYPDDLASLLREYVLAHKDQFVS